MSQRRLALHASALSDAEYAVYTASLKHLVLGDPSAHAGQGGGGDEDDGYFARMQMGVREARAWLRGRYADVPVQTIDTILRFFSTALAPGDTMAGTEFFAALRLVVHASNGTMGVQDVDRGMAFIQADPTAAHAHTSTPASRVGSTPSSRAQSPSKRYNPFSHPHPHPTHPSHLSQPPGAAILAQPPPPPHPPQHPSLAYASYRRPDAHRERGESAAGSSVSASRPRSQGPGSAHSQSQGHSHSHTPSQGQSHTRNPFTAVHAVPIASSSTAAGPPQIPPRKPPSEGSVIAPPSTPGAAAAASKRKSAPPVPPPRRRDDRDRSVSPTKPVAPGMSRSSSAVRGGPVPPLPSPLPLHSSSASVPSSMPTAQHITTPLMRQSLHASQIGQSLQKAEARMEKERVMQVLRTSAGAGGAGISAGEEDRDRERGRAPPLPQRRPSGRVAPPPPAQGSKPSGSGSGSAAAGGVAREAKGRQQLPSPPSSMGSIASIENVALAGDLQKRERERMSSRSPTKAPPPPPQRRRETVSSVAGGLAYAAQMQIQSGGDDADADTTTPSRPPPTHPDRARRNLESFEAVYGPTLAFPSSPGGADTLGVGRSPFSPVSPPPHGSASGSSSPSTSAAPSPTPGSGYGPATPPGVSPRVFRSKSMHYKPPVPPPFGAGTGQGEDASASPFASSSSLSSSRPSHLTSPAPPPPPARRKRPESFQVLPSSITITNSTSSGGGGGPGGPFGLVSPTTGTMNAYGVVAAAGYGSSTRDIPARGGMGYVPPAKPFNAFGAQTGKTKTAPVRRSSLSVSTTPGVHGGKERDADADAGRSDSADGDKDIFAALAKDSAGPARDRPNPIAGLKSTFASANAALLPTLERAREGLDKARYKAEAGLSRRGYMRHNVGYGYASGARGDGDRDAGGGSSEEEEAPLSDARVGARGEDGDKDVHRAMGGLSIARERERDRARERQEMAGLVGGVDGRMKAPSMHTKKTKKGRSRDVDREPAAASGYGYGLERDWNSDEDRPSVDAGPDVDSDDGEPLRSVRARGLAVEKDSLKWPAGEGWKPL